MQVYIVVLRGSRWYTVWRRKSRVMHTVRHVRVKQSVLTGCNGICV